MDQQTQCRANHYRDSVSGRDAHLLHQLSRSRRQNAAKSINICYIEPNGWQHGSLKDLIEKEGES